MECQVLFHTNTFLQLRAILLPPAHHPLCFSSHFSQPRILTILTTNTLTSSPTATMPVNCGHYPPIPSRCNLPLPSTGTILGNRWYLHQKLGSGGFNQVYSAQDIFGQRKELVAIKVPRCLTETGPEGPEMHRALRAGSRVHVGRRNVLLPLDVFYRRDHRACVVLPKMDGSLEDLAWTGRDPRGIFAIYRALVAGLHYLHESCNIVHCDIKPENILITKYPTTIKYADFSGQKITRRSETFRARDILADTRYRAPEFWVDQNNLTHRIDVWSLGVVFYRLWNDGHMPYAIRNTHTAQEIYTMMNINVEGHLIARNESSENRRLRERAVFLIKQMLRMNPTPDGSGRVPTRCSARYLAREFEFEGCELR
ncbi:kinase-like protein [Ascodesmis nigricans]|uniref:Kinase-like protein n=1 Tax=Ascodesmis nigricans TaxID=341454 RepID=A0A4S2MQ90_9PEZI|nr:kinase-like protein [Ascodesmis nigricans]